MIMFKKARTMVKTKGGNSEEFVVKVWGTSGICSESIIVCGCDGGSDTRR